MAERKKFMKDTGTDMRQILFIKKLMKKKGLIISGESKGLIEVVELKEHPWFMGVQFHPEFTSRLQKPNRVILAFVEAALKNV